MAMIKRHTYIAAIIFLVFSGMFQLIHAQNLPLEVKLSIGHLNVFEKKGSNANTGFGFSYLDAPDSVHSGFNLEAEFRLLLGNHLRWIFQVSYDRMRIYQNDVLDEWDWPFWEESYIENIPGIDADSLNKTLFYESVDGVYRATFIPTQELKELCLATGFSAVYPFSDWLQAGVSLAVGASMFSRELQMREHWTKHFVFDTLGTENSEYDYKLNLLHFAPAKKGTRFFVAPSLDLNISLSQAISIEFSYKYIQYMDRASVRSLEDLFQFAGNSDRRFPLRSKYKLQLGIVFKY